MKRIIYSISFLFVAIIMMAQGQTSFIVADKNGNSQLVQSLSFQKEQYGDRTSSGFRYIWKGDGTKRGIIEDLGYIARTNSTLATGSVDDVTTMLEQISGSNQADAEAIAGMLTENANVEEALSSSDGQSLIIKYKDTDVYSVYPISLLQDPFDDDANEASQARSYASNRTASAQFRTTGTKGKVAVFNYFSNQVMTRKTQNKMLEYMMYDLNNHGYGVEYYPYEEMTVANIKNVIAYSSDYIAVIVMSHGFSRDKHSYFAIGEAYDKCNYDAKVKLFVEDEASENNKVPFIARFWNEGFEVFGTGARYDCAVNVNKMSLNNNVILYMGSCDAYKYDNFSGTCIGWDDSNATAQAHVALLFYYLMHGKTIDYALDRRYNWNVDQITKAHMKHQLKGQWHTSSEGYLLTKETQYFRNGQFYLNAYEAGGPLFTSSKSYNLSFYMQDNLGNRTDLYPKEIYIKATPLRSDSEAKIYKVKKKNDYFYKQVKVKLPDNGVYVITAADDKEFTNEILIQMPIVFVKATPFKENGGEPDDLSDFCPDDNHPHMIDLGLPSGTKWACCNVGASSPEEYGGYYAWGEVENKDYYDYSTYIHCDGSESTIHNIGSDISGTEYDVAHIKWGGEWVMPNNSLIDELYKYCSLEETTQNGVNGLKFTGPNEHSIFLPAGGHFIYSSTRFDGADCEYWSSQLQTIVPSTAYYWGSVTINKGRVTKSESRCQGNTIRPVIKTAK